MSDWLLAVESIGKAFRGRVVLRCAGLWGVSGRITAIVGRNGAGKSTLLRIAAGWVRPDHGVVVFDGVGFDRPRLAELARRGLFLLPERGLLSPAFTLSQHLAAVEQRFPGVSVSAAVDHLRLRALLDCRSSTLSGGERRRAELGIALAREPRCLLADEPFLGIMPTEAEVVAHALRTLAARGVAVVVTGHEVGQLFGVADDVLWMTAGTTHHLGPPAVAWQHRQFEREYLGGQWEMK